MSLADAKKIMVKMPAEVFDGWLGSLIDEDGTRDEWPFKTAYAPTNGTIWRQYLDGHTIKTISDLAWKREQIPGVSALFNPSARERIKWIIDAHIHGRLTPVAKLKEGKAGESFFRSREFIKRTGRLHTPPILIKQFQGYQIMDGNHRLAALFSIPNSFAMLDCWVGHIEKP